jgi:formylglycine-generating enzyme required for sulfatase activity
MHHPLLLAGLLASILTGPIAASDPTDAPPEDDSTNAETDQLKASGFVLIPGGTFQMGDSFGQGMARERPVRDVTVSSFFLKTTETTKAEWDEVYAWALTHGYEFENPGEGKAGDHPVHSVNWYDVLKWCNARSEKEGLVPCYFCDAARKSVYRSGRTDLTNHEVRWTANGYRLPTEAEWEMAARGGLKGKRFPWGDTITHSQANYLSMARVAFDISPTRNYHPSYASGKSPFTAPTGSFAPNAYGLCDMAGNLWEVCWDRFSETSYQSEERTNPRGPLTGNYRSARGGAFLVSASFCRVSCRSEHTADSANRFTGFRQARRPPTKPEEI